MNDVLSVLLGCCSYCSIKPSQPIRPSVRPSVVIRFTIAQLHKPSIAAMWLTPGLSGLAADRYHHPIYPSLPLCCRTVSFYATDYIKITKKSRKKLFVYFASFKCISSSQCILYARSSVRPTWNTCKPRHQLVIVHGNVSGTFIVVRGV